MESDPQMWPVATRLLGLLYEAVLAFFKRHLGKLSLLKIICLTNCLMTVIILILVLSFIGWPAVRKRPVGNVNGSPQQTNIAQSP